MAVIGGADSWARYHDHVLQDWLKASAKVLAGFDQNEFLAGRVDTSVGEHTDVIGLVTRRAYDNFNVADIEHGCNAKVFMDARVFRASDDKLAVGDTAYGAR